MNDMIMFKKILRLLHSIINDMFLCSYLDRNNCNTVLLLRKIIYPSLKSGQNLESIFCKIKKFQVLIWQKY